MMATEAEIAQVRLNTHEPTAETWSDIQISSLIDDRGISDASAEIWRTKAAQYAELVDVSEAGSSHSFSDLQTKALEMARQFSTSGSSGAAKVKVIERD